jgi:hypothetical protein
MTNFEKRLSKGQLLYDELLMYMSDNNIEYFLTGYENLNSTQNARLNIIRNTSKTSLFVRHYPDITTTFEKDTVLIEVKNSSGIEYHAYNTYRLLRESLGLNILLFLKNKKFCKIEDLRFNKTKEYDSVSKMIIPIKEEYFRAPELLDKDSYLRYKEAWKNRTNSSSGDSFAFINFEETKFFDIDVLIKMKDKFS